MNGTNALAWGAMLGTVLTALVAAAEPTAKGLPNPFYAMDTAFGLPGLTTEQQLDLVKQLGYAGISWTEAPPEQVAAILQQAEKRGLKMFAIYFGATLSKSGMQFDPRLADTLAALQGHDTLIWLHIGSKDFARSSPDGDAVAVPALREVADQAAARGLRVAIYPHTGEWAERVQDAVRLAKKVDRRNFGVTFNLCHCLRAGDEQEIPAILQEAAPYLFMVTINGADSKAPGAGWDRLIQTLDRGTFDLVPVLRKLKSLGYQGPIGLQGYGIQGDRKDNLARSMAAWRQLSARAAS